MASPYTSSKSLTGTETVHNNQHTVGEALWNKYIISGLLNLNTRKSRYRKIGFWRYLHVQLDPDTEIIRLVVAEFPLMMLEKHAQWNAEATSWITEACLFLNFIQFLFTYFAEISCCSSLIKTYLCIKITKLFSLFATNTCTYSFKIMAH